MSVYKLCVILFFLNGIATRSIKGKKYKVNSVNPEENGIYFEGDIVLPEKSLRSGIVGDYYRWPKGIIPYVITGNYTTEQIEILHRAFATFHKYTCIKFIPRRSNDTDYINITDDVARYCFTSTGRIGGEDILNLGKRCFKKFGTSIHELMHNIGFWHEQARTDRDDYVDIHAENIRDGMESNFDKKIEDVNFNQPYDYASVLHYSPKAFSKNANFTIAPKDISFIEYMGQRKGLSKIDITKVNLMYNCPEKTATILKNKRKFYFAGKDEYRDYLYPNEY
ncbi:zinc metalloproteinase nas-13-like [Diabrotica virgifera virgifera]|uniref:Metalloendopeptidase n=1 Tax=Diabrotica virgifera virgifera TaxID=50390 RepID=A0ABM5JKJ8_DIAVI|nr:zinc metalloproteinase nas-13-like [Diabrotica virgifera virgifera]